MTDREIQTMKSPAKATKKTTPTKPKKVAYPRLVDAILDFCDSEGVDDLSALSVKQLIQNLSDAFMDEARS